jgi:hypothetical protein
MPLIAIVATNFTGKNFRLLLKPVAAILLQLPSDEELSLASQHPNQDQPLARPNVTTWLDQYSYTQKSEGLSPEKSIDGGSCHGAATLSRTPFTPMKSGPELVPETPSSEDKRAEIETADTTVSDGQINHGNETKILRDGPSKRRARILESSDEESENVRLFSVKEEVSAPSRKKKRTFSAESSDDEPEVVDVEGSIHLSVSSMGDRSTVDLTSSAASPQDIVLVSVETSDTKQEDTENEQDPEVEESVNELLSKCEEVGEGLRKQVGLAVIEQPKCVGSDKLRLKKYQLVGLTWLNNLHMRGVNGILAGTFRIDMSQLNCTVQN